MKLYTKEMFLIAAEKCEVSMIDAKHIIKYIDEYVTPIELPTDEESAIIALKIADALKDKLTSSQEAFFLSGFQTYAKWMRDKIKGGQGE